MVDIYERRRDRAVENVGHAIQDAVRNGSRQGDGEELWFYSTAQYLAGARLAEIGMTGSFDIDLPDGSHFVVTVRRAR